MRTMDEVHKPSDSDIVDNFLCLQKLVVMDQKSSAGIGSHKKLFSSKESGCGLDSFHMKFRFTHW
jgi:hypothetical protein